MPTPLSCDLSAWTALVVEDEPRLREALVEHLRQASFSWRAILQAGGAEEALALCRAQPPDLAFLDIRLSGMSGLELALLLPTSVQTVFVTAYDAHAIQAFEAGAVDYLLKPVTQERIQKTLERIRGRAPGPGVTLPPRYAPPPVSPEPLRWITASSGRRTHWIPVEEVVFFQADSKYTRVECREASYLVTSPIKELAAILDARMFQQVHRSTIVNLHAVAWLEKQEGEGGILHLRGHAAELAVSATYLRALNDRR